MLNPEFIASVQIVQTQFLIHFCCTVKSFRCRKLHDTNSILGWKIDYSKNCVSCLSVYPIKLWMHVLSGLNFSVILLHFDAQSSMMFKNYSWLENSSCLCLPKQLSVIFSAFRCPESHDWISQGFENSNVTKMKNVQTLSTF